MGLLIKKNNKVNAPKTPFLGKVSLKDLFVQIPKEQIEKERSNAYEYLFKREVCAQ
jgi:hypothetical protein